MASVASEKQLIPLKIDVTSDTICPFCFIGLRKLEKALELSPYTSTKSPSRIFEPQIQYLPYQLDPTLPNDQAYSKQEMYAKKFGADRFEGMVKMMKQRGKDVGIDFSYGGPVRGTTLSHRILAKAHQVGGWEKQYAFLNKIFPHYFEKEGDPGEEKALATMAYEVGIFPSQAEAEAFAHSDELKSEVENGFLVARRKGISGVPNFEIEANDPTDSTKPPVMAEIPGAQEPETIAAFIGKIAQRVAPQSNA